MEAKATPQPSTRPDEEPTRVSAGEVDLESPVAIFGCGLIGASLAAAWSAAGATVWGADRRDLASLIERGWIARQVSPDELQEASLVVLALPPQGILGALRRLPFRPGQVVTDTGSVKAPMEEAAASLARGVDFVGGHPLSGDTGQGYETARADLYRGAPWALSDRAPEAARRRVEAWVRLAGAEPVVLSPERHDAIVALTSHLPQLLSTALAAEIAELDDPLAERLLGPGGKSFLRLAESPFGLWREILSANREAVASALSAVSSRATQPAEALEEDFALAGGLLERLRGEA
jgi:prephenate dehydrogenase